MSTRDRTTSQTTQDFAKAPPQAPCPACHVPVESTARTAPFCSKRCRLVDLGKWFDEEYVISRDIKDADLDQGE